MKQLVAFFGTTGDIRAIVDTISDHGWGITNLTRRRIADTSREHAWIEFTVPDHEAHLPRLRLGPRAARLGVYLHWSVTR